MVARVVAVASQSGGAGKTTSTTSLAALLAAAGSRVLVVDGDGQCDSSFALGVADTSSGVTLDDVLAGRAPAGDAPRPALHGGDPNRPIPRLDLLAGSPDLALADQTYAGKVLRDVLLRNALAPLLGRYDVVLVDCPPSLGLLVVNIFVAADWVIACGRPGIKELRALSGPLALVEEVRSASGRSLQVAGVLVCDTPAANAGRLYQDALRIAAEQWPDLLLTPVPRAVAVPQAYARQVPLPLWDPQSPATAAYRRVGEELQRRGVLPKLRAVS